MEGFAPSAFRGTGYYLLIIDRWETIPDTGGAGLHRGGNGVDVAYRFLKAGTIAIHDDRWLTYPWGVKGGEPGARGTKWIDRADGTREVLPSKVVCDDDGDLDAAATDALRASMLEGREEPLPLFNRGVSMENLLANSLTETGLPAPTPPLAVL